MIKNVLHALIPISLFVPGPACTQMQAQPADRIFFSSFRPEGFDIYLSTDQGKTFTPFTDHPALEYDAVITPDGQYVVYTSEQSGQPQLYIKAMKGGAAPRRLIESRSMQDQAAFSPNGRWILFVSSHEGNADIYRLPFDPDSSVDVASAENLTRHPGGDFRPSYSPDGTVITFCSDRANPIKPNPEFSFARHRTGNIFRMDTTGQQVKQLTFGQEWDGSPVWSPDGKRIFYYVLEDGLPDIYAMHPDGSGQKRITPKASRAMSPCVLPDGKIGYTSWQKNVENSFRILTYDTVTGQKDTLVHMDIDMLHLHAHPGGAMVFHGCVAAQEQVDNKGAFHGNLLIPNQPFTDSIDGEMVETYGVRRAFVAPVFPNSPHIITDSMEIRSLTDAFSPWLYAVLVFPLFITGIFFTGIIQGIRRRKAIAPWRFLLASFAAIAALVLVLGICFFFLMQERMPLLQVRLIMMILALLFAIGAWMNYRKTKRRKNLEIAAYRVSRLWAWILTAGALVSVYLAMSLHMLFNNQTQFFKVNYLTRDVTPLFTFKPGFNLNPSFAQFIDGRVSQDGKQLLFTIGGFGAAAHHQGDIWMYDFERGKMRHLADSKVNDGFGDMSADGKRMVFRSGRSGNFDVYVQDENGITPVTRDTFKDNFPAISPRGDKIVYASDKAGVASAGGSRTFDLYLHAKRGDGAWSEARKLTDGGGQHAHPSFSPDGEWVIYSTEAYGIMDEQPLVQTYFFSPQMYGEIVAVRLRDMKKFRLTHNKWEEGAPQWVRGIK